MASAASGPKQLWTLVAAEMWRKTRRRLRAGPKYRWRFSGRVPERVLVAPPDLRLADPETAHAIYSGRFPLSGHLVETGGQSPFQMRVNNRGWLKSLHAFRWLRHLHAAGTDLAASNARALVTDWITVNGSTIGDVAWEPGTVAKRVIAWLQHSTLIVKGAEMAFYRSFLRSLAMQVRYLRWAVHGMPDGKDRLRARIAIAFSALALPASPAMLRAASRLLGQELSQQILPDGGHISRNPLTVMELLADLLPLRQTYASQAETPPDELLGAIDRMLPALRFFQHRDGSLARFNGMGVTIHDRIGAILQYDDAAGASPLHAPHSGYDRLSMGDTVIVADTGAPPAAELSNSAHAGCLSFEFSAGRHLIIVNCGVDTYGPPDMRPLGRATAAHSTATLNDTSQARFSHSQRLTSLLGRPLLGGPKSVTCERRDSADTQGFAAVHDAYLPRVGLLHEREMQLSDGGNCLTGFDRFHPPDGTLPLAGDRDAFSVRFHIHPDIAISGDYRIPLLSAKDGMKWRFLSPDVGVEMEESIFFASLGGPRRCRQIVLAGRAADTPIVRWRFERMV